VVDGPVHPLPHVNHASFFPENVKKILFFAMMINRRIRRRNGG